MNRFISRSTDKCLPFYQLLRSNKRFVWDDKCEAAFRSLKQYLTTPPVLAKPELDERLYLYIAVSAAAVNEVLVRDERGEQQPIFYVSKTISEAELRYPALEKMALAVITSAQKLQSYFSAHPVSVMTNHPLRAMLHSPSQSRRLVKWAIQLGECNVDFRSRTAAKAHVLANFIVELPPELAPEKKEPAIWQFQVDGASSSKGACVRVRLESPTGEVIEQSFRLKFSAPNNESKYEALLAGMRLARGMDISNIRVFCDSQLVASQVNGEYTAKNARMDAYLAAINNLASEFDFFEIIKIPTILG